jgi:hypothetical protein
LDGVRDNVESGWDVWEESGQDLVDDLEANTPVLDETPTDYDSAWNEGWESAIQHVRDFCGI